MRRLSLVRSAPIALCVTYGAALHAAAVRSACVTRMQRRARAPLAVSGESGPLVCPLDRRGPADALHVKRSCAVRRSPSQRRRETRNAPRHARNEKTKCVKKGEKNGGEGSQTRRCRGAWALRCRGLAGPVNDPALRHQVPCGGQTHRRTPSIFPPTPKSLNPDPTPVSGPKSGKPHNKGRSLFVGLPAAEPSRMLMSRWTWS